MRTRATWFSDYGFEVGEAQALKEYCQRADFSENVLLLECAIQVNPCIGNALYYSITSGVLWDKLSRCNDFHYGKSDFCGYQRRTLALFRDKLLLLRHEEARRELHNKQSEIGRREKYNMALTRYEQETIINFNAEEDTAELYTADLVWMRKLDKLVKQNPEQFKEGRCEKFEGKVTAKRYIFPKRFVTIRSKDVEHKMTDEQKERAAQQLRNNRKINSTLKI